MDGEEAEAGRTGGGWKKILEGGRERGEGGGREERTERRREKRERQREAERERITRVRLRSLDFLFFVLFCYLSNITAWMIICLVSITAPPHIEV